MQEQIHNNHHNTNQVLVSFLFYIYLYLVILFYRISNNNGEHPMHSFKKEELFIFIFLINVKPNVKILQLQ